MHILLFIYVVASLVLLPFARPASLLQLDALHWAVLAYCAFNTIGAYGAFAEAPRPLEGLAGVGGDRNHAAAVHRRGHRSPGRARRLSDCASIGG